MSNGDFDQIRESKEFGKYCDQLLEAAMVRVMDTSSPMSIDPESYEEVRSIAMDLETDVVDPEA